MNGGGSRPAHGRTHDRESFATSKGNIVLLKIDSEVVDAMDESNRAPVSSAGAVGRGDTVGKIGENLVRRGTVDYLDPVLQGDMGERLTQVSADGLCKSGRRDPVASTTGFRSRQPELCGGMVIARGADDSQPRLRRTITMYRVGTRQLKAHGPGSSRGSLSTDAVPT